MNNYPYQPAAIIFNGTFTIENPHTGKHRTLRIKTQSEKKDFAPGKRVISLLTGPDNTKDYTPFGFVFDDGVTVWRRYRSTDGSQTDWERLGTILWSLWTLRSRSPYAKYGLKLIDSCTCCVCNRPLTDVLSALTGLGPCCAEKKGIDREKLPKRLLLS